MTSIPDPIATVVAIRAAHHPEAAPQYDRVVFEFSGPIPLLRVEYVHQLIEDGSGAPVAIKGNAILLVQLTPARAHDDHAQSTAPGRMALSMPNVKEIVRAGDFEANLTYGVGVAQKAYTRILTLANPSRVVIDLLRP
jgi:hypothetical protein